MSWKPKDSITAKQLIEKVEGTLQQIDQWEKTRSYEYCHEYQCRAEQLIELIEAMHCGSVGGVGCGFPVGRDGLQKRLDHLKKVFK